MGGFPDARAGASTGDPRSDDRARVGWRRVALRIAFVGSAASGFVLAAGAAAHADLPDPTSVASTTVDTTTSATDAVAGTTEIVSPVPDAVGTIDDAGGSVADAVGDAGGSIAKTVDDAANTASQTVVETAGNVTKTVDHVADTVTKTVDDVADTVTKTVDDVADTVTKTVDDVADTVTKTAGGVVDTIGTTVLTDPTDPATSVLDEAVSGIAGGPAGIGIAVRSGSVLSGSADVRDGRDAVVGFRSDAVGDPSTLPPSTGSAPTGASAPSRGLAFPPASSPPPLQGASLPSPVPFTVGLVLALIGVIALRSPPVPPAGWLRRLLPTTAFHGAAVALSVERPG
jgi:hypothetical protein